MYKVKREIRICKCDCKQKFKCKVNSKKRFIWGHNSKLLKPKYSFKKNNEPWNIGLTKEIDERVKEYGKKGSITKKGMHCNPKFEFKAYPLGHKINFGGRTIVKVGRKRYVDEYRLIAEKYYRKLEKGEHVHHIDLDFTNNIPENLYICSSSKHKKLHSFESIINKLMNKGLVKFNRKKGEYYVL